MAENNTTGQTEGLGLEQLMKAFAKLSSENAEKKRDTYLDWKYFDFKVSEENHLRGSDNWEMWKTVFWAVDMGRVLVIELVDDVSVFPFEVLTSLRGRCPMVCN
ncbi:hypothetical protein DL771_001213 [Monosporascus sp. 5C6A]|nr:hypothetical protein DL771_001213 [Monosporascus sp. 5C6A]